MNKDLHLVIVTTTTLEIVMKHTLLGMEVQGKFHLHSAAILWKMEEYSGAASKEFAVFTKIDMVTKN